MTYWGDGMSGFGIALMALNTLLFCGFVIAGVFLLVRHFGRGTQAGTSSSPRPAPQQLLAERFAQGEIAGATTMNLRGDLPLPALPDQVLDVAAEPRGLAASQLRCAISFACSVVSQANPTLHRNRPAPG